MFTQQDHKCLIYEFSLILLSWCDGLQDVLSVRGSVGQLHAQLPAPEPGHAVRREDLHHTLGVPRGKTHFPSSAVSSAAVTFTLSASGRNASVERFLCVL